MGNILTFPSPLPLSILFSGGIYYYKMIIFVTDMHDFRIPGVFGENERYETENH